MTDNNSDICMYCTKQSDDSCLDCSIGICFECMKTEQAIKDWYNGFGDHIFCKKCLDRMPILQPKIPRMV